MLIPTGLLCLFQMLFKRYWKRPLKGLDCLCDALQVDPQARPKESKAPHPYPVHGIYVLPTVSTVGATFKNAALTE